MRILNHPATIGRSIDGVFLGVDGMYLKDIDKQIANAVLSRYYKGLEADNSNAILVEEKMTDIIPLVVDKNDKDGNYCRSADARLFVNDEPIARTLTCKCGGGQEVHHNNMVCVAMRGRNPENPSDRTKGCPTEQRLEMKTDGCINTLTTVQKDNLVLIKQATKDGVIPCKVGGCFDNSFPSSKTRRGRVQEDGDVVPTLTAGSSENINYIEPVKTKYRIRKLTPKECWRLMGYKDEDFEKAKAAGVSNSQLYKQAGNAIVKQVLMGIFAQMIPNKRTI